MTVRAQEITYNTSTYQGGANISCNGAMDGWINIVVVGGTPPYLYTWNNGSFSQNLSGIGAGSYTVQVTDAASQTASMTIELFEPGAMGVNTVPSVYEGGYNISVQGGQNGSIEVEVGGGTPPYTYLWNTGSQEASAYELTAGTYSVTVTDMNGCTASGSRIMTEPTPLHIVSISSPQSNGFHITCNEAKTGSIQLTVAGGVPPYDFRWSNGDFREDPTELGAGHYWVMVYDANHASDAAQIVLTQPDALDATLTPVVYPNGKHLSCYGCSNGSITVAAMGGAPPYQYAWAGGQTNSTLTSLTSGTYSVTITDANGCSVTREMELVSPEREDWTMMGNSGTDPNQHYIGTIDNKGLSFRTNQTERLRVEPDGTLRIRGLIKADSLPGDTINQLLYVDANGVIRSARPQPPGQVACSTAVPVADWKRGNDGWSDLVKCPTSGKVGIGTLDPQDKVEIKGFLRATDWNNSTLYTRIGNDNFAGIIESNQPLRINYNNQVPVDVGSDLAQTQFSVHGNGYFSNSSYLAYGTGMVGIGTTSPSQKLEVVHTDDYGGISLVNNQVIPSSHSQIYFKKGADEKYSIGNDFQRNGSQDFFIWDDELQANVVFINASGNIGLGTNDPGNFRLAVEGKIGAHELKVQASSNWHDDVFFTDYALMPLNQLEVYLKENCHLPGIPTAQEVKDSNGFNVGQLEELLLQKIEELTLYAIEQHHEIKKLSEEIQKLNALR